MSECVVYWIFDETCIDPSNSGYVGVTKNVKIRFSAHIRNGRVPVHALYKVLFEGTREQCFAVEFEFRPIKGIGWNRAVGGVQGWKIGFKHSENALKKMRGLKRGKKQTPEHVAKRVATTTGQKRPKQSASMRGSRNPTYGTKRPKHVVEAMRRGLLGKPHVNRQEIYCVGCHQRASKSVLAKYHTKCWRLFCEHVVTH